MQTRRLWRSGCCLMTLLSLTACGDIFDYHPYDVRFGGEKNINARNIARIEADFEGEREVLRIAFIGDTQGWYDDTQDMITDINRRDDVDFVVHGGDLSNYGATQEFVRQRDILKKLKVPYVVLIGNHDCLGTGEETFYKMFGEENFSFIAGRIKFVCLNTNALEYDYGKAIPNFDYMQQEWTARRDEFDRTVICMHAPPFNEQFNNNVNKAFEYYVTQFPSVLFCTAAHVHRLDVGDLYGDGVMYYTSDSANHRNYLLFTITQEGYNYEVVDY